MSELYSLLEDFREDYRHNPSFGSLILEDLYTSSGRIIILPIGRYLHILTFLSGSSWRQLVYIQSELILSGHLPLCLGRFSFIFHSLASSLILISLSHLFPP